MNNLSRMIELIGDEYLQQALIFPPKAKFRWKKISATAACIALIAGIAAGICLIKPETESVYIPKVEISNSSDGIQGDMFGIVVYNGRVYTQAEYIDYQENPSVKNLAGEYLGTTVNSIGSDCTNPTEFTPEFLSENLASNVSGDVYSVKGYDKAFRICIPEMYKGCGFMAFFECLNDISFSRGSEIFGDRLHMRENFDCLNVLDVDTDKKSLAKLDKASVNDFITGLYSAKAVEPLNSDEYRLFSFSMTDGTSVQIRLYEGGYAAYRQCRVKFGDISAFNLLYEYQ